MISKIKILSSLLLKKYEKVMKKYECKLCIMYFTCISKRKDFNQFMEMLVFIKLLNIPFIRD